LAIAIWVAATLGSDPFEQREFPNVPVQLVNQREDTILFEPINEQVTVEARAPASVLKEIKVSAFEAVMDLSAAQPGVPTSVPIQVTSNDDAIRIVRWSPPEQNVHLEALSTITLPVTIDTEGQVATGYQATSLAIQPEEVSVLGPDPLLTEVKSVSGVVDVENAKENVEETVRVRPLDVNGELVPGLQWTPDDVQVQVGVRRRLGFKPDVEVVPDLRGEPASGYRRGSVAVEPSTVTLAGLPSVLEQLPGFVETYPISVTGATQDLVQRSPLTVPNNIVVVGVDFVTVTVEVLPIQTSRAMTATVEIRGVSPGWIATPSPSLVDVILEGPDAILAGMTADDIRVILDVFGYPLGVHRVEPDVLAPQSVTVVSIIPETIEVAIEVMPIPTPSSVTTPTVTTQP
jgi:YbbR domain-containing protein